MFSTKIQHVKAMGETFPLTMDLNVYAVLQEEYGTLNEWHKRTFGDEEHDPKIMDLIGTVRAMVNEGIEIENEAGHPYREPISMTVAGMICQEVSMAGIKDIIRSLGEKSKEDQEENVEEISPRTN